MKTPSAPRSSRSPSRSGAFARVIDGGLRVARRVDRFARANVLWLLVGVVLVAFLIPDVAARLLARRHLFSVPLTSLHYEPRTLALAIIVLSASLRYRPRDLARVFRSNGGFANLLSVYVVVPAMTVAIAIALIATRSPELRAVATGLVLCVLMPVAMTSAVWTRASRGSVTLALGTLALTSALAVFLIPIALGRIPGAHLRAVDSASGIRAQVVVAFALPLVLGMALRAAVPGLAKRLETPLSLLSVLSLLLSVADCTGALKPHLRMPLHLIVAAGVVTVSANALAFGVGYLVARLRGLGERETISVVFASGMRSTPAAMVVGILAFPDAPLVALAPILWSVSQQLLAGIVTRQMLLARESVDETAPMAVRQRAWPPPRRAEQDVLVDASRSETAVELEESLVMPLVRRFNDTLDESGDGGIADLLADTLVQSPRAKLTHLSAVIRRRELL